MPNPRDLLQWQLWDFASAYVAAFERAAACSGLTPAQAATLDALSAGSRTMRELADKLMCDASNVTQLIGRLEIRGLVARTSDAADRRVRRVAVTAEGRRASRAVGVGFSFPRERLGRLDEAEKQQLARILAKLL